MSRRREAKDLTPGERNRILEGWQRYCVRVGKVTRLRKVYYEVASTLLNVHEDTIRLVLSEEGK